MEQEVIQQIQQHISVLNEEFGQIQVDVAVLKSQMGLLLWLVKAIGVVVVGNVIASLWQIRNTRKNGLSTKKVDKQ